MNSLGQCHLKTDGAVCFEFKIICKYYSSSWHQNPSFIDDRFKFLPSNFLQCTKWI